MREFGLTTILGEAVALRMPLARPCGLRPPWRKMRRSRAPSIAPGTFFIVQYWADCITNIAGFNLRQAPALFGRSALGLVREWPVDQFDGGDAALLQASQKPYLWCQTRPKRESNHDGDSSFIQHG